MLRTPLRRSEWLSEATGASVYLKLETLQPTFSYKIRGAWNAVLSMKGNLESETVVAASAGNHGRALAYAARSAGMRLRVYVPETAPSVKVDPIRRLGADVRIGGDYDAAERLAKQDARESGCVYISGYSHPDVIAGAGTVGLEILEEMPDVDTIVVPVGGGGLISGVATAGRPDAVVGVEAAASSPFTRSLAAGRIVSITVGPTLADGLAGNLDPDTLTFDIVQRLVREIVVVSEDDIRAAVGRTVREERVVIEGAAATAIAAVMTKRLSQLGGARQRVAVVVSGGNIDPEILRSLI